MRSISPKLDIVDFSCSYKVSKYCNIMERRTGSAVPRNKMHEAQPATRTMEISMSRRKEYHPKTPVVI